MSVLQFLGLILVAGGVGGLVNSLITDKGLTLPHAIAKGDGTSLLQTGFIGNVIMGAIASSVSWLLYGPVSQTVTSNVITANTGATFTALGSAILVGMAGSGWLSSTLDKHVLQAAAVQAAIAPSNTDVAQQMMHASPTGVFQLAKSISGTAETSLPPAAPIQTPIPVPQPTSARYTSPTAAEPPITH